MPKFQGSLSSKLPKAGTSIFTVMSGLSAEQGAINLSQGFPDFGVDPQLIDLVTGYMKAGHNQYAPMPGLLSLRKAISQKIEKSYSLAYNPESEITITSGATQAIYSAISAVVKEGDEVILFTPAYDCYSPAIELNGGKPIHIQLQHPYYTVDWNEVKKTVNYRTKLIIINTPHNPTGSILSAADMMELEKITHNSDILILSDEVYEHIIFDGYEHQSVARFPKLAERSFIVYSFGKTFHATGWKLGYCVAPEKLMHEFRKTHQFQVFACNHPMQAAMAEYISVESNYNGVSLLYQQKRDLFNSLLKGSRFVIRPSAGTYFQLLDYSAISKDDDLSLAQKWTKEQKVSSIPVSVFYHKSVQNGVLRFCFAKQDETLARAAQILASL
ncbi:MAG: aminotransferase class I/II-fold pyridoxal phosphate-dependent enzyme [Flavobacteriales bacterium]|nr:aminotransferase class I/II-fold pyridoxal phosphate-dependent enzyme [Flavobacteriales bacterium]